jgi:hypothetical protein
VRWKKTSFSASHSVVMKILGKYQKNQFDCNDLVNAVHSVVHIGIVSKSQYSATLATVTGNTQF